MTDLSLNDLADFEAYWHSLRGGDMVPQGSRFDPRGIPHLGAAVTLLELEPGQDYRLHRNDQAAEGDAMESVEDGWRDAVGGLFDCALAHPCGLRITHGITLEDGGERARVAVALPLMASGEKPNTLAFIVAWANDGDHARRAALQEPIEFIDIGKGVPELASASAIAA